MAIDYFLLIVVGFFGVLQVVASHSDLYGLRLFSGRIKGYVVGAAITVSAFVWFFASGKRNVEGHITGVQGSEQFGLFLAGISVSIFVTALVVSIRHLKSKPKSLNPGYGLEQIRQATYLQAFLRYLKGKN